MLTVNTSIQFSNLCVISSVIGDSTVFIFLKNNDEHKRGKQKYESEKVGPDAVHVVWINIQISESAAGGTSA
jgi:hypothetical protein